MKRRALIGILLLPLLFIVFSPAFSFAVDEDSEMLDELEKLLEGDFNFDSMDEEQSDDADMLDEIDTIMEEQFKPVSSQDADNKIDRDRIDGEKKDAEEEDDYLDLDRYVKLIEVKGGCFSMGDNFGNGHYDERPTHRVCVDDFAIADTEVTQELWEKVAGFNPSQSVGPKKPVDFVSWADIKVFIALLNERTNSFFRLPTEAEWEYAARGRGKLEEWSGTNEEDDLMEFAWFDFTSSFDTHPVKQKRPNLLGLYDMTGNVMEWVHDFYDMGYYKDSPTSNPEGPEFSVWKGLRGGAFADGPRKSRTTSRTGSVPTRRSSNFGFRLAE